MRVEFQVKTSPAATTYKWFFEGSMISPESTDYEGSSTENLIITKCLPKHKGAYMCLITNEKDETLHSEAATLNIGKRMHVIECFTLPYIL